MIGETVGNFEIIAQIGKGGWGSVYLAQQKSIKTQVAIKVLETSVTTNAQHVERFFNEAVAVSKIHHSGIVRIFDVGTHTNGQAYLVMEYLEGETLTSRIRSRTRLPLGMVADFGRQIASVLDATHSAGITHRDLKPDNIYLVHDAELINGERVKVLDFGIAKLQQPAGGGPRMTSLNAASIGTPNYMSPEQWHSLAEADWRSDAYALGCVAFEMACGRPPFLGESATDVCAQHLTEPPPVPSSLVPGLPPLLDKLIARLLEKEPAARPTLREALQIFTELGHSEGIALRSLQPNTVMSPFAGQSQAVTVQGGPVTEPVPPPAASQSMAAPSKKPRRVGLFLALGAIAIAGSVAAGVVITSERSESGSAAPQAPSGSAPVVVSDAAVAVVTPPSPAIDAAAVAVSIDAGLGATVAAELDKPVELTAALAPVKSSTIEVATPTSLRVCVDEAGKPTSVGPDTPGNATPIREVQVLWTFEPHVVDGKPAPACFPLALEPRVATTRTTPRTQPTAPPKPPRAGSNAGSAPPPVAVETPPERASKLPETLSPQMLKVGMVSVRAHFDSCASQKLGKDTTFNTEVTVTPDGKGSFQFLGAIDPALKICLDSSIQAARFKKTQKGARLPYSLALRAGNRGTAPSNSGGDPEYP